MDKADIVDKVVGEEFFTKKKHKIEIEAGEQQSLTDTIMGTVSQQMQTIHNMSKDYDEMDDIEKLEIACQYLYEKPRCLSNSDKEKYNDIYDIYQEYFNRIRSHHNRKELKIKELKVTDHTIDNPEDLDFTIVLNDVQARIKSLYDIVCFMNAFNSPLPIDIEYYLKNSFRNTFCDCCGNLLEPDYIFTDSGVLGLCRECSKRTVNHQTFISPTQNEFVDHNAMNTVNQITLN